MKIRIVHTLRDNWLYGVRIKTYRVSVRIRNLYDRYIYAYNLMNI